MSPKSRRLSQHNRNIRAGVYNTPHKFSNITPSTRRVVQNTLVNGLNFNDGLVSSNLKTVNKSTLDEYNIEYVLEAVAQIITAKKIRTIKLWTPFGECHLNRISENNYFCITTGTPRISTRYQTLLCNLSGDNNKTTRENIINFLVWKANKQFYVNLSTNNLENSINTCLKEYNKNYSENRYAAAMCGILISEMIRSAGKIVRAAFKPQWPDTYSELKKRFVLANKNGGKLFRRYMEKPNSVPPEIVSAIKKNAANFSPDNKKRRRISTN